MQPAHTLHALLPNRAAAKWTGTQCCTTGGNVIAAIFPSSCHPGMSSCHPRFVLHLLGVLFAATSTCCVSTIPRSAFHGCRFLLVTRIEHFIHFLQWSAARSAAQGGMTCATHLLLPPKHCAQRQLASCAAQKVQCGCGCTIGMVTGNGLQLHAQQVALGMCRLLGQA